MTINLVARRTTVSGVTPRYTPKISFQKGLDSLNGALLSLIPFALPIILFKVTFNNLTFGEMLFDKVTNPELNKGRIGIGMLIVSVFCLLWISTMIFPKLSHFDKNLKSKTDQEINEMLKTNNDQKYSFAISLILFSFVLAIEYVVGNEIVLRLSKINEDWKSIEVVIVTQFYIQVLYNVLINGTFVKFVQANLIEPFYVLPFNILSVVNILF
jgi:hypothetical protein